MKVELSIKDDKELRNMIKDMIRGQVKALIREDLQPLMEEEVTRQLKNRYISDMDIHAALRSAITKKLPTGLPTLAREEIRNHVDEEIKYSVLEEAKKLLKDDLALKINNEINLTLSQIPVNVTVG